MMTPSQMDVLRRASDEELLAADIKLVDKYVKGVLFEKTVFLWNRKALDTNGKLHKDYLENCRPLLANGELAGASKQRGGAAIHEHCVEFDGKGWVLQQLVVKQKVKLITGSSEFIHE
jgi:hypothetical protein